jgi:DNA-binding transcriptional LysR family regulator
VRLRILPGGSAALAQAVADGTLDLALLSLAADSHPGLTMRPLAEEPLVLMCAPGHPLAGSGGVPVSALGRETFVDFPVGWGARTIVDRAFGAAGVGRQVAFEVADYGTAAGLVRNGLGVAFVPESAARALSGVAAVPVTPVLGWRIQVAFAASRRPSAAARALLDELLRSL